MNLASVSFVDAAGVAVLQFLMARGVEIVNMTALVDAPLTGGAFGHEPSRMSEL